MAPLANELPEDVLLLVFRRLHWRELLLGPWGVCRSWREAAMHPALWNCVKINLRSLKTSTAWKILSFAPCLEFLHVGGVDLQTLEAAGDTDCAVASLSLEFSEDDEVKARKYQSILQRQVELGRLQELCLHMVQNSIEDAMKIISETSLLKLSVEVTEPEMSDHELTAKALQQLALDSHMVVPYPFSAYSAPSVKALSAPPNLPQKPASLQWLMYSSETEDPLLEFFLEAHAGTLESVELQKEASSRALELLGGCLRLKEARLRAMPGVSALGSCTLLRKLTLHSKIDSAALVPLTAYFSTATQLTELLFLSFDEGKLEVELLAALGSSGQSALQVLGMSSLRSSAAMLSVLRGFPQLHTLRLDDVPPSYVLTCLTPRVAPSLRLLVLCNKNQCHPSQCCLPRVCDLVRRMPQLHVAGLPSLHVCINMFFCSDAVCDCCRRNLHDAKDEFKEVEAEVHFSLYGHRPYEDCGLEAHARSPEVCCSFQAGKGTRCRCKHRWVFAGRRMEAFRTGPLDLSDID